MYRCIVRWPVRPGTRHFLLPAVFRACVRIVFDQPVIALSLSLSQLAAAEAVSGSMIKIAATVSCRVALDGGYCKAVG